MSFLPQDLAPSTGARIAGFGLLAMAFLGIFANFFVLESMIVEGNAISTIANIEESHGLFRLGVVALLIVALLDVLVAMGLYIVLKATNSSLALLAAFFRFVYAGIFGAAIFNLAVASQLIEGTGNLATFQPVELSVQIMVAIDTFMTGWMVGLIFFGIHLLLLGYLVIRSGFMPRIIGVLLVFAAIGYLVDSFAQILMPNYSDYETRFLMFVAVPGIIGELSLMGWLLLRGARLPEIQVDAGQADLPGIEQKATV
jgi:hypothetical protein